MVTGASRGLGAALSRLLAAEGYALVIDARGGQALEEEAARLRRSGATVAALPGDVGDGQHRAALVRAARELGGLDLLVNNASDLGPTPLPPLAEVDMAAFGALMRANVGAPLALVQAALPLLKQRRGTIVNITSDAARGGYPGWGAYGASKAALELVSLTLANELRADGVSVVTVDPGDLRTQMHQDAFPGQDISDRPPPEVTVPFWAWLLGRTPLEVTGGRFQAQAETWQVPA
jgi:NAD(P)-dependent dehydrogenase (short-subunit alcohol dehydrogenase family)